MTLIALPVTEHRVVNRSGRLTGISPLEKICHKARRKIFEQSGVKNIDFTVPPCKK